jgi:hypothetical protein
MPFDAKFAIRLFPAEGQPDITPEAVAAVLERHFALRDRAHVTEGLPRVLVAVTEDEGATVVAVDGRVDLQLLDMRQLGAEDRIDELLSHSVEVASTREYYQRDLAYVRARHVATWGEPEAAEPEARSPAPR